MVYCGKPSPACSGCRTRRIKCDQNEPSCSQCIRAGKICSGYRDQTNLMFRDENDKVIRKSRATKQTCKQAKSTRSSIEDQLAGAQSASTETLSKEQLVDTPSLASELSLQSESPGSTNTLGDAIGWAFSSIATHTAAKSFPPINDAGIEFFFKNYIAVISYSSPGKLDLTSSPIYPLLYLSKGLSNAVSCVGYAGLSNATKDPGLMVIARKKYSKSISDVTADLKDIGKADLAATFKTVMVLAAFEIVNCCPAQAGKWGVHLEGGYQILKLMQASGPRVRPAPLRMQMQFIVSVYIKCLSHGENPPEGLLEWTQRCNASMKVDDAHAASMCEMTHRFITIYTKRRTLLPNIPGSEAIFLEALLLDSQLALWENDLPAIWQFRTQTTPPEARYPYSGKWQVSRDMWCSRVYNNYRWLRILVNELLLEYLGATDCHGVEQAAKSQKVMSALATDICTSVSPHFTRYSTVQALKYNVPLMSGCFQLQFPLVVAAGVRGVSRELHDWALSMLEVMGNEMGIGQAATMVPFLRERRRRLENCGSGGDDVGGLLLADLNSWVKEGESDK